jgi:pre-mRNA-splicing factor SYF1
MPIWSTYLTKFVDRFQGTKIERARDLFEQAIEKAPPKEAKIFYLLYAKLEEDHGLARRAMLVYDRATRAVEADDKWEMFKVYIRRAADSFGVARTREIYQKAMEILPDKHLTELCMQFVQVQYTRACLRACVLACVYFVRSTVCCRLSIIH